MARGRPSKWVTATVIPPITLGKSGIEIVVWDKWGKRRRGTAIISVGGIRWYPYKRSKRYITLTWERLDSMFAA